MDLKDLSVFQFPGNSSVSAWIDREALTVTYTNRPPGTQSATVDAPTAQTKGVGTFAIRANIVPISKEEASFWISFVPFSTAELTVKLGAALARSPQVPSISLPIAGGHPADKPGAKSSRAVLGVQGPPDNDFGIGPLALLDISLCPNAPQLPNLDRYKEATIGTYRAATMVTPATATSVVSKLEHLKAGKVPDLKLPKEVFAAF